jgi:hypothetical protein
MIADILSRSPMGLKPAFKAKRRQPQGYSPRQPSDAMARHGGLPADRGQKIAGYIEVAAGKRHGSLVRIRAPDPRRRIFIGDMNHKSRRSAAEREPAAASCQDFIR